MTEEVARLAAFVMEKRGYIVFGSEFPHDIGDVVDDIGNNDPRYLIDQPCRIIAETDRSDLQTQRDLTGAGPVAGWCRYFYRVVTD